MTGSERDQDRLAWWDAIAAAIEEQAIRDCPKCRLLGRVPRRHEGAAEAQRDRPRGGGA